MTTLTLFVRRQAMVTLFSSRRLFVLFILLLVIFIVGASLLVETASQVTYDGSAAKVPIIVPNETSVCIGGNVTFPLLVFVSDEQIPDQVNIAESWCLKGIEGACFGVIPNRPDLPLLEPKNIKTDATMRTVPSTLQPGTYHFWHSATDATGNVSGYIVAPIVVKDCQ